MDYIIKDGTVVNEGTIAKRDLFIHDGRIVESAAALRNPQTFSAKGCYVIPGVIDTHVHFRDPGFPDKADFATELPGHRWLLCDSLRLLAYFYPDRNERVSLNDRLPDGRDKPVEQVLNGTIGWVLTWTPAGRGGEDCFLCARLLPVYRGPRGADDGSDDRRRIAYRRIRKRQGDVRNVFDTRSRIGAR